MMVTLTATTIHNHTNMMLNNKVLLWLCWLLLLLLRGDQLCKFCGEMLHNLFDNIILVLFQYIINNNNNNNINNNNNNTINNTTTTTIVKKTQQTTITALTH